METNFEIEENYAVRLNGTHIDLHNNFDFVGLIKDGKNILIDFEQSKGDWVKKDEFKRLNFEFKNVVFEYYVDGDSNALKEEKVGLSEITFISAESIDINDSIIPQSKPQENDDLMMFFQDGKVIRICCEKIKLTTIK